MKKLTIDEFKTTIANPRALTTGEPSFDFWHYVENIPIVDFGVCDCSEGNIHKVYRMQDNHYEHVLIASNTDNVVMALVNDLEKKQVYGHCLLNFDDLKESVK